jgi:ABC-type transport system involved in multi-copper enzyme maturation permease subunit
MARTMSLKGPNWQEVIAGGLWLAGAAGLFWLGPELPLLERVILWVVLLVGLVIVLRRFWSWLLGPLFFYDVVRTARRNQLIPVRCLYSVALLTVLFFFYGERFGFGLESWEKLFASQLLEPDQLPKFAGSFFSTFMAVQFIAVLLLAPIFTAGPVAEERERGTLDLLLTTSLTSWEIVFGLLAARLANLTLVVVTGLPILCLVLFLGGVDIGLIIAGFAGTGALMLMIGTSGIMFSVLSKNSFEAISMTYFFSICFAPLPLWNLPVVSMSAIDGSVEDAYDICAFLCILSGFFASCFLICAASELRRRRRQQAQDLPRPQASGRTIAFSVINVPPAYRPAPEDARNADHPPVSDSPMMWKELNLKESRVIPPTWLIQSGCIILGIICVALCLSLSSSHSSYLISILTTKEVVRYLAIIATAVSLVPVGVAASKSITEEREKKTLDSLAASPLEAKEILYAKCVGSIVGFRWLFIALASFLLLAVCGGEIEPVAFALLLFAWVIFAAFFSCLGLFFSTICKTTLQATIMIILAMIALVVPSFLGGDVIFLDNRDIIFYPIRQLIRHLSPVMTFRMLTFDTAFEGDSQLLTFFICFLIYVPITLLLWNLTGRRFKSAFRGGQ